MKQKHSHVSHRFNEIAREKLASILMLEMHDPALSLLTLTACDVSPDRSNCIAYVSCEPERYDEVTRALGRASGRIRSLLGKALGWYCSPRLDFRIDPTTDEAQRIALALKEVPPTASVEKDEFGYPLKASPAGMDALADVAETEED